MRPSLPLAFGSAWAAVYAQDIGTRAQQLEARGDSMAALDALRDAVKEQPENIGYLTQYAEFLAENRVLVERIRFAIVGAPMRLKRCPQPRRKIGKRISDAIAALSLSLLWLGRAAPWRSFFFRSQRSRREATADVGSRRQRTPLLALQFRFSLRAAASWMAQKTEASCNGAKRCVVIEEDGEHTTAFHKIELSWVGDGGDRSTTLMTIGVVYAALSAIVSTIVVITGLRANASGSIQ